MARNYPAEIPRERAVAGLDLANAVLDHDDDLRQLEQPGDFNERLAGDPDATTTVEPHQWQDWVKLAREAAAEDRPKKEERPIHVYIAGPISKDPLGGARAAIDAASKLQAAGLVPYVPHLCVLWELVEPRAYDDWMALGLAWLEKCDALFRLPGESKGADIEAARAYELGIPVFTVRENLLRWAREVRRRA